MTKPSRFGEGNGKFSKWGRGQQVTTVPEKMPITFSDFSGGYNSAPGEEEGPPNSSPDCQDVIISKSNRLVRMPGAGPATGLAGMIDAFEMVVHQSLQNVGELIFFGPPSFATISDVGISVTNVGLPVSDELFRWALYGETLVFSNGRGKVYTREPSQLPVISDTIPLAKAYGVIAARLFAGGTTIEGEYQPMGIAWGGSVDFKDFDADDAGFELLISDSAQGDAIVAVQMMNLDLLGIICKQSVWIGRRTQDPFRPAAFEPRVRGVGGLHNRACIVTPLGFTYLAETGLRTFDGNNSILLSGPINNELLPVDFDKITDYRLSYDYKRNWIYLHTPPCTWILDIESQRWYKMAVSGIVDSVIWKEQISGRSWDEIEALGFTWDDQDTVDWSDYGRHESGWGEPLFLKRDGATSFFWSEDTTSQTWPEHAYPTPQVPQVPHWEFRHKEGKFDNTIVTVDSVIIKYKGAGDVRCYLPNNEGNPTMVFRQTLPGAVDGDLRAVQINMIWSGKGASARLELVSGNLEIAKFQMGVSVRSTNPSRPGSDLQEYIGFWDIP